MEALHRPTVLHELGGEIIEEFRVRGLLGHIAEIVHRGDEAFDEVLHPSTVDGHAGGHRVFLGSDGLGELIATAAVDVRTTLALGEDVEELAGHDLALVVLIAALEHVTVLRSFGILHDHRLARSAWVRETQLIDAGMAEVGDRLAVTDTAVDRTVLPVGAELTGAEERDHVFVVEDLVVARDGPRIAGHLGDGRRGLLPVFTGFGEKGEVREDGGLVLVVRLLVSGGDVMERLRLQATEGGGDDRVDRMVGVADRFLNRDRGALGEIDEGHLGDGVKRTGDRRVLLDAHRGEIGVFLEADLVTLGEVTGFRGTAADAGDHEATSHLVVVAGAGLAHITEEAGDLLVLELAESLGEVGARGGGGLRSGGNRRVVQRLDGRGEDAVQGIVILNRNRVELMVVTAGAGHRESEEGLGARVDAFVDDVVRVVEALADGKEAERGETRIVRGDAGDAVGSELLDDELVVRLIVVQRVDDVIAIGPSVGETVILEEAVTLVDLEAAGIGVAGGIEPVASPAFTVVGRGEEAIDLLGVDRFDGASRLAGAKRHCVRDLCGLNGLFKGIDLLRGGRKADQIVGNTTKESFGISSRIRLETFLFEFGHDERIDGRLDPGAVLHFGNGRLRDGLEGPVITSLARETSELGGAARRHGRTHLHPLFENGDFVIRKLSARLLRGHRELGIVVTDGLDEERLLEIARDNRRSFVAALVGAVHGIEDEATFGGILLSRVALVAAIDENRAHVLLEELEAFLGSRRRLGGGSDGEGSEGSEREGGMTERQHGRVS